MSAKSLLADSPLFKIGMVTALLVGGVILAEIVSNQTRFVPLVLGACLLLPFISFARANMTNLVLSFILADHVSQFLKRAIFVIGPQQKIAYYGFQALSVVILGVAAGCGLFVVRREKWPLSIKILFTWVAVGILDTGLKATSVSVTASLGGIAVTVMPVMAVFLGMSLPMGSWRSVARLYTALILISVAYGLYQYFIGYTVFDEAWAFATHAYSIQGSKVYDVLIGATEEVRAYSYYADFLTWGLFLVGALLFVAATVSAKIAPKRWLYLVLIPALSGILICGTRTVWVGLLGAVAVQRVISMRGFRRPLLVMVCVFTSFGMVLWLGGYAMSHTIYLGYVSSRLLKRYETVGTISARISAPEIFIEEVPSHLLVGEGFGSSGYFKGLDQSLSSFRKEQFSHNVIVDVLLSTGLTGVMLLMLFLYAWLRDAFWAVRVSTRLNANALRWIIAAVVGMVFTGGLNGLSFMTAYFFLLVGLVAGEWSRLQADRSRIAIDLALPLSARAGTLARQA